MCRYSLVLLLLLLLLLLERDDFLGRLNVVGVAVSASFVSLSPTAAPPRCKANRTANGVDNVGRCGSIPNHRRVNIAGVVVAADTPQGGVLLLDSVVTSTIASTERARRP